MAKYWVYLNDQVKGPYEVDQLIRLPGFSRQTMVSVDDSGGAGQWISPASIPDLARIFQKADEMHDAPTPGPRPAPKPVRPRMPAKLTPVPAPVPESKWFLGTWIWVLLFSSLVGGGLFRWYQIQQQHLRIEERQTAQTLVETAPLPAASVYSSIRQYLQSKQITPRWDIDRAPSGVYNVTLACSAFDKPGQVAVYSFETNLQVQSVRGLNTAAIKLLSDGFSTPVAKTPAPATAPKTPKKSSNDQFPGAINDRRKAFEKGDFDEVWQMFSERRQKQMEQGGITAAGFAQMQKLTYRPGSGVQQTIVKTKAESENLNLVLLRQAQPKHPDIYIKQTWIWENNAWRLDDEEKKVANAVLPPSTEPPAAVEKPSTPAAPSDPPRRLPAGLPGFSDLSN